MKNLFLATTILSLTAFSSANAQDASEKTFAKQSNWKAVALLTESGEASFVGLRTNRGTLRVKLDSSNVTVPFEMKVESNIENSNWMETCKSYSVRERIKAFDSVKLIVRKNPFSAAYPYSVENLKNEKEETISLSQIENAPKISNYRIKVLGNDLSNSVRPHFDGYAQYLKATENELNLQIDAQKKQFDLGSPIELNLSSSDLKTFACDMSLKLTELSIVVDMKAEVAKVDQYNWIEKEELASIYKELKAQPVLKDKMEVYRAGIKVGQAFQKINSKIVLGKNERDFKILETLFKQEEKESNLFSLKALSKAELDEQFDELPELKIPTDLNEDLTVKIKMSELKIFEGK